MNRVRLYLLYASFYAVVFILSLHNLMTKYTLSDVLISLGLSILVFSGFITYLFKIFQEIIKKDGGKW